MSARRNESRCSVRAIKWLSLALGMAVLAACADAPRLAAPSVTVDSVRLDRITGTEARFDVMLDLRNPNAREIAVDAIDANVTIEDVPVGTATLKDPLRVPAHSAAAATLQARAGLSSVVRIAADFAQRAKEQKGTGQPVRVRYTVSGSATLEGGWTIPFSRSGEFLVGTPATPPR